MENKKELMVFDVAKHSWKILKENKLMIVGLSFLYAFVSALTSFVTEPEIAAFIPFELGLGTYVIVSIALTILSVYLFLTLMINIYHAALGGEKKLGMGVITQYPLMNYLRSLCVLILFFIPILIISTILIMVGAAIFSAFSEFLIISILIVTVFASLLVILIPFLILRYFFAVYETLFQGQKITSAFRNSAKITAGVKRKMILGHALSVLISFIAFLLLVGIVAAAAYLVYFNLELTTALIVGFVAVSVLLATALQSIFAAWITAGMMTTYVRLSNQTFNDNN